MKRSTWVGFYAAARVALAGVLLTSAVACGVLHRKTATAATNSVAPVSADAALNANRWKVKADTTPFYRYGPQQLGGSDLDLKKEARITMIQRGHGFSQITTVDHQTGFVGTEDIVPLSAQEIAAEDAQRLAATASTAPPGALTGPVDVGPRYTMPSEAGHSESLPAHDTSPTPTPPPATIFRY